MLLLVVGAAVSQSSAANCSMPLCPVKPRINTSTIFLITLDFTVRIVYSLIAIRRYSVEGVNKMKAKVDGAVRVGALVYVEARKDMELVTALRAIVRGGK